MRHIPDFYRDVCSFCGATRAEIEDDIATVECLGPVGYKLRKAAMQEVVERRIAEWKAEIEGVG